MGESHLGEWEGYVWRIKIAQGDPLAKPYPFNASSNASISQIVVSEDRWKLRRFNDTTHLTPGFSIAASPVS